MNLLDQVEVLRHNLPIIQRSSVILPLNPDYSGTRDAYRFANLIHPARDIFKRIKDADPGGDILPSNLRRWQIRTKNNYGNDIQVELGRVLNSIMHMHYLSINDNVLDVENENLKERYIVDRNVLLEGIGRLLLTHKDVCLVSCALAEKGCEADCHDEIQSISNYNRWYRDLWAILARIHDHVELSERVWHAYFLEHAEPIGSRDIIRNLPFAKGAFSSAVWRIGWRRDDLYAAAYVRVPDLVRTIRDYAEQSSSYL